MPKQRYLARGNELVVFSEILAKRGDFHEVEVDDPLTWGKAAVAPKKSRSKPAPAEPPTEPLAEFPIPIELSELDQLIG